MEFVGAWLSGLVGSVHCAGMCGGFATACSRRPGGLAAWHIGRITVYAALGALAGIAGVALPGPAWIPALLATTLLFWFTLGLAGWLPEPRLWPSGLVQRGTCALSRGSSAAHLGFGLLNGLLPCGLVYSALALSVAVASPWRGALAMAAFGLGTVPVLSLSAVGLRRIVMRSLWRRRAFALLVLATGCWTIWARAALVVPEGMRNFLRHCATLSP
jgi:sulfite exporter TauE/SafE